MATETTATTPSPRSSSRPPGSGSSSTRPKPREWVAAMETEASGGELVVDVDSGVYGHRVTMLDFQPEDLARFREMALVVGFEDRPPQVMTALSISGSAAQSKINAYPADCDFFERVHITGRHARGGVRDPGRPDAREGALDRGRADASAVGGQVRVASRRRRRRAARRSVPDRRCRGRSRRSGPARWRSPWPTARCACTRWEDGVARAGLVQARLGRRRPRRAASSPTRATCSTRRGRRPTARSCRSTASSIPYYQEVYLEADSIPLFSKLVKELSADSVDDYVDALEHEVWKYTRQGARTTARPRGGCTTSSG